MVPHIFHNRFTPGSILPALKVRAISLALFLLLSGSALMAQVGVHTDFPDASSAMEIYSTNRGLLIPRVTLTNDLTNPSPVTSPAVGLLIFNNGANQPVGFYYWDGSAWVAVGAGGGGGADAWWLTGNAGTNVGSNFVGTTDNVDFAIRTNNAERMRVERDGQIVVGATAAYYAGDLFTVVSNTTQNYAMNLYSPNIGLYSSSTYSSVFAEDCRYGMVALLDTVNGFGVYAKNYHTNGQGLIATGGNSPAYSLTSHVVGVNSNGKDGLFACGHATNGVGIIAIGNSLDTASSLPSGTGGAFTGYTGIYSIGVQSNGNGIIAIGNNYSNFSFPPAGCGGAFTGFHGVQGTAKGASGIGVTGLGGNSGSYFNWANGLGASFAGYHGVISLGNNSSSGTGVIGAGNNGSYTTLANGSGGAFTGAYCGAYGFATNTGGDRYGGYFASAGNINPGGVGYAYVGGRFSGTQAKIIGTGTVNTIVKNTEGELIALTCPEAPEMLFQDYGIGQLVDGRAHITIDPDLAINIRVDADHPLKVYITPEGDCNGVYVTNKSIDGFDVVELMGGTSNITFSWQIVATRADEYAYSADGSRVLVSDYSKRFPLAPGPLQVSNDELKLTETVEEQKVMKTAAFEVEDVRSPKKENQ